MLHAMSPKKFYFCKESLLYGKSPKKLYLNLPKKDQAAKYFKKQILPLQINFIRKNRYFGC